MIDKRVEEDKNTLERMINASPAQCVRLGKAMIFTHNSLQQNFMRVAIAFIEEMATNDRISVDARNEDTVATCKYLWEHLGETQPRLPFI